MSNNKALKGLKVPGLDDIYYVPDINQVVYMDVEDNENVEDVAGLEAQIAQIKTQLADKVNSTQLENSLANKVSIVEQNLTAEQQATVRENIGAASSEDVSAAIANTAAKIGDTLTTMRTDLDDTWLLCNGDEISASEFPELAEIFPKFPINFDTKTLWEKPSASTSIYTSPYTINFIKYINGYWVAGGSRDRGTSDDTTEAIIAYTKDLSEAWTIKTVWWNYGSYNSVYCLEYADGYWVAGGTIAEGLDEEEGLGGHSFAHARYTTDLENGSWTNISPWTGTPWYNHNRITCITYNNGYWVLGGSYYSSGTSYGRLAHTKDITSKSWVIKDLWSAGTNNYSGDTAITGIKYANRYWVAVGKTANDDYNRTWAEYAYTTDLEGTWTKKSLLDYNGTLHTIKYINNYWIAVGHRQYNNTYNNYIAYTTNPEDEWSIKTIWTDGDIKEIAYGEGYYIAVGRTSTVASSSQVRIAYGTDFEEEWTTKIFETTGTDSANSITFNNPYWAIGAAQTSGCNMIYSNLKEFILPTISHPGIYTYIKAKED